jgi:hypothetical protein
VLNNKHSKFSITFKYLDKRKTTLDVKDGWKGYVLGFRGYRKGLSYFITHLTGFIYKLIDYGVALHYLVFL